MTSSSADSDIAQSERGISSTKSSHNDGTDTMKEKQVIGVLSPHNSKETKAILNAVRTLGYEPIWIRDENVTSWIDNGTVKISPEVDVVINRILFTKSEHQFEDLQLAGLYAETVPIINQPTAVANTLHKYRAGVKLAAAGLPVPDAYFSRSTHTFDEWSEYLPNEAVHKRTIGTNGRDMAVVSSNEPISPKINDEYSFVQEFLESENERPYDVRVYVVGDKVVGAMQRHAPEDEWRTNVALGA
ncbi:MAG: RimK family alpha-L-glutamate ligase, partial [Halobacteriaceae archaeon]